MYKYITLPDETEINHSEMKSDGRVKVYIERPDAKDSFHHATCWLPNYQWENIFGFSSDEISDFQHFLEDNAHLIIEFSQEGGFANASNF